MNEDNIDEPEDFFSYDRMQAEIVHLVKGKNIAISYDYMTKLDPKPEWLNEDKVRKGQEFAKNNYFLIVYADLISLYLLFSVESILNPLIYTNKSSTIKTAFKRYLSTTLRVTSWYDSDILDKNSEGRKNINIINQIHTGVLSEMTMRTAEEIKSLTTLKKRLEGTADMWSSGCPFIRKDLESISIIDSFDQQNPYEQEITPHINQYNMAVTQFGFIGLIILYSEKLGILCSEDDMESFMHLWRYIGYLVGIKDEYNICNGSYQEVKLKCKAIAELIMKPNLAKVTQEWEHMSYVVCTGVDIIVNQLDFQSTVCTLMYLLDLNFDEYFRNMSWKLKLRYYYYRLIFDCLIPFQFFREYFNNYTRRKIKEAVNF